MRLPWTRIVEKVPPYAIKGDKTKANRERSFGFVRGGHGGKMTKSAADSPGKAPGQQSTVKIEGSGWSKEMVPIVLNLRRPAHQKSRKVAFEHSRICDPGLFYNFFELQNSKFQIENRGEGPIITSQDCTCTGHSCRAMPPHQTESYAECSDTWSHKTC